VKSDGNHENLTVKGLEAHAKINAVFAALPVALFPCSSRLRRSV
jgi:hypothetical protein